MSTAAKAQPARVALPSQLARLANGSREVLVEPGLLSDVFEQLDREYPMLRSQIFKPSGDVRQFVGLFVDDEQVLDALHENVHVRAGATLRVVVSVAGG